MPVERPPTGARDHDGCSDGEPGMERIGRGTEGLRDQSNTAVDNADDQRSTSGATQRDERQGTTCGDRRHRDVESKRVDGQRPRCVGPDQVRRELIGPHDVSARIRYSPGDLGHPADVAPLEQTSDPCHRQRDEPGGRNDVEHPRRLVGTERYPVNPDDGCGTDQCPRRCVSCRTERVEHPARGLPFAPPPLSQRPCASPDRRRDSAQRQRRQRPRRVVSVAACGEKHQRERDEDPDPDELTLRRLDGEMKGAQAASDVKNSNLPTNRPDPIILVRG